MRFPGAVGLFLAAIFLLSSADPDDGHVQQPSVSFRGFQLWSVTPTSEEQRQALIKIQQDYDLDMWKKPRNGTAADLLISPDFQTELKMRFAEKELQVSVTIDDLETAISEENPNATDDLEFDNRFADKRSKRSTPGHKMNWDSYHRHDDISGYLQYLSDTYTKTVKLINIGKSSEGRPLNVIRISSKLQSTDRPAIWIDGGIHAREWISPAVATYIIQQLVEFPENDHMIANVDWYVLPVMNPDGYEYTHTTNRMWRKTRSKNVRGFCSGTDPNRNFGYKWNGKGTSQNSCSDIYSGKTAFSEPETRAVSQFILSNKDLFKMYLTFHSYGQYWLLPFGYDVGSLPSDYKELKRLATKAAKTSRRYKYTVGNSAELMYPAAGGSDDWAKGVADIKYSYTIELPDTGRHGFVLPSSSIKAVTEDFFPAMQVLADHVSTTYG